MVSMNTRQFLLPVIRTFAAFGLVACVACWAVVGAATQAQENNAATAWQVQLLDGNPQFVDGVILPAEPPDQQQQLAAFLQQHGVSRRGAVTDGVSILVLRAITAKPGVVGWSLPDEEHSGRLGTLAAWSKSRTVNVVTQPTTDGKHVATALYQAPREFGDGEIRQGRLSRSLRLTAALLTPDQPAEAVAKADREYTQLIELAPPPVVLVHGTYHNPQLGWETPAEQPLGERTFVDRLRKAGLQPFLVDYEATNGAARGGPSHLADNQKVVWENPGGIREALKAVRQDHHLAITQVDLIGHSQGGLLARAYALGRPLPRPASSAVAAEKTIPAEKTEPQPVADWYRRKDNFYAGDIRRLITLCTPHYGSDLPRVLLRYGGAWSQPNEAPGGVRPSQAQALLQLIDMMYGMTTGAFQDQSPGSEALLALGKTPILAHAVACTADPEHFAQFGSRYRWSFLTMYLLTPPDVLKRLFDHEQIAQPRHAQALVEFLSDRPQLHQGLFVKAARAMAGYDATQAPSPLDAQYDQALALIYAAVFGNQPGDGAVRVQSALGGLPRQQCSVLHGVLHSFAPRYTSVQQRMLELLLGPDSNFAPGGFPPAGKKLTNLQPGEEFKVEQLFRNP